MDIKSIKSTAKKLLTRNKPNIFYIHIPKTGGTSVDFLLRQHYQKNYYRLEAANSYNAFQILHSEQDKSKPDSLRTVLEFRENLIAYEMIKGKKYISGHVAFNINLWEAFHEQYLYVTLLRDPIKRYISHYFYNTFKDSEHRKSNEDFLSYMASDFGQQQGYSYVKLLGGLSKNEVYTSPEAITQAKNNLDRFHVAGILENINDFTSKLETHLGRKVKIPHKRKNPVKNPELSQNLIDEVRKICQPDLEVYEYAKTL